MIVTDVSRVPERHKRELLRGERVQAELAILAQRRLKAASDLLESRHIEGLGQRVMCLTREMAARLRARYGSSCLHDPDFRKRLLQKNPFLRVWCAPAKFTLRVNGLKEARMASDERRTGDSRHSEPGRQCERDAGNYGAQREPATPSGRGGTPRPRSGHETSAGVSLALPRGSAR